MFRSRWMAGFTLLAAVVPAHAQQGVHKPAAATSRAPRPNHWTKRTMPCTGLNSSTSTGSPSRWKLGPHPHAHRPGSSKAWFSGARFAWMPARDGEDSRRRHEQGQPVWVCLLSVTHLAVVRQPEPAAVGRARRRLSYRAADRSGRLHPAPGPSEVAAQRPCRDERADAKARPGVAGTGPEQCGWTAAVPHVQLGARRCRTSEDRVRDSCPHGRGMDHGDGRGDLQARTRLKRNLVQRDRGPCLRISDSSRQARFRARAVRDDARLDPLQSAMAGEEDASAPEHHEDDSERRGRSHQDPARHAAGPG